MPNLCIHLSPVHTAMLTKLATELSFLETHTANELLEYLAHRVLDGITRPESWERAWLSQATGWPHLEESSPTPR